MNYSTSSLTDIVKKYIKDQVLSGALKSGDKVVEAEISDILQISRAPVREAFSSLNEQGILAFSPRRFHVLWEIPREEVFEIFQIRISLELQVLSILVTNNMLTQADFLKLEQLVSQMKNGDTVQQTESERVFLLNSLDLSFHKHLWTVSNCIRRAKLLENLFYQLLIAMNVNLESLGSGNEKAEEHQNMIKALKSGDTQKVCLEFRNHLQKYIYASMGELSTQEIRILNTLFD